MPYDTPIKDVAQALRYLEAAIDVERSYYESAVAHCSLAATLELLGPTVMRSAASRDRSHNDASAQAAEANIARLRELRDLLVAMEGNRDA